MRLSHSFYGHKELQQEVSVTFIIVLPALALSNCLTYNAPNLVAVKKKITTQL